MYLPTYFAFYASFEVLVGALLVRVRIRYSNALSNFWDAFL